MFLRGILDSVYQFVFGGWNTLKEENNSVKHISHFQTALIGLRIYRNDHFIYLNFLPFFRDFAQLFSSPC